MSKMIKIVLFLTLGVAVIAGKEQSVDEELEKRGRPDAVANLILQKGPSREKYDAEIAECVRGACSKAKINPDNCNCFSENDSKNFTKLLQASLPCFKGNFCGANLLKVKMGSFTIPLAVPQYQGHCLLIATNLIVTCTIKKIIAEDLLEGNLPLYSISLFAIIENQGGLSVKCTPIHLTMTEKTEGLCLFNKAKEFLDFIGILKAVLRLLGYEEQVKELLGCQTEYKAQLPEEFRVPVELVQKFTAEYITFLFKNEFGFYKQSFDTSFTIRINGDNQQTYADGLQNSVIRALRDHETVSAVYFKLGNILQDIIQYHIYPICTKEEKKTKKEEGENTEEE